MILNIALGVVAGLMYLFLFWRHLKDDYVSNQIFTTGFFTIAFIAIVAYLSQLLVSTLWFWLCIVAVGVSTFVNSYRFRMRKIEVAEAQVVGLMPALALLYLASYFADQDIKNIAGFGIVLLLFILFFVFNNSYKRFSWYRSGRVGFAGFATLGFLFLARAIVAINFPFMISFVGALEIYSSLVASVTAFAVLIYLARQT